MEQLLCNQTTAKNILDGSQTQDRRPIGLDAKLHQNTVARVSDNGVLQVRCPPENMMWQDLFWGNNRGPKNRHCKPIKPPHQVGDVLYVRETWRVAIFPYQVPAIEYRAGGEPYFSPKHAKWMKKKKRRGWHPNIHMPKWAARTFVEVTGVKAERVQEISREDILAEGIKGRPSKVLVGWHNDPITEFKRLWNSLYPGTWEKNIWVWAYTFKKITKEQAENNDN